MVPFILHVSEWVQHQDAVWWVQSWLLCVEELEVALVSEILQEAGRGQRGQGTQWVSPKEWWRNCTHEPPICLK